MDKFCNFVVYTCMLWMNVHVIRCNSANFTTTRQGIVLSEGDTYRVECQRSSTDYLMQFVKFDLFYEIGSGSSGIIGPFTLTNEDVLEDAIQDDSRYTAERIDDLNFVFTLNDVTWQDQGTFGCRAYTEDMNMFVQQKVTIPGPLRSVELVERSKNASVYDTEFTTPLEEIRVRESDPLKEFVCHVNTTNSVPNDAEVQMNGEKIQTIENTHFSPKMGPDFKYQDNSYVLLSYPFTETERYKDKKSVYMYTAPGLDDQFKKQIIVALEYEPDHKDQDCTQTSEITTQKAKYTIACHVMAYPFATPVWSVGGDFINDIATPAKYEAYSEGSYHDAKYYLSIHNVTDVDFSTEITFQATNVVGNSSIQRIKLEKITSSAIEIGTPVIALAVLQLLVFSFAQAY